MRSVEKMTALLSVMMVLNTLPIENNRALAHSKGLYATQIEAQARAKQLGCTTTHQNNDRWMPCSNEQELHKQLRKQ